MNNETEKEDKLSHLKDKISGAAQTILGEIETLGGVITADPGAQAGGEFNVEVGSVREEIADELESSERKK